MELEAVEQELKFGFGLGIAGQQKFPAVGGRQMDIDHLDGSKFLQDAPSSQARSQAVQAMLQGDIKTIGEEGDEDMGLDPAFILMKDRADRQVPLQIFEGLFDRYQLDIIFPEKGRIIIGEICPQQIAPLPAAGRTQEAYPVNSGSPISCVLAEFNT